MIDYQLSLLKEHSELVAKINALDSSMSEAYHGAHRIEYANRCIQLTAMRNYESALRARLECAGIIYDNGYYLQNITPASILPEPTIPNTGNDYDEDNKPCSNEDKANEPA